MISFIKGEVVVLGSGFVVIENNGMGYHINVSMATLGKLPKDKEVKIYTHMQVREDDISLYGFAHNDELNMFKMLTSVSGIGPKGALAMLDSYTPSDIMLNIISEDAKALSKAKGVGLKTAGRIILELKDKMKTESVGNGTLELGSFGTDFVDSNTMNKGDVIDAIDALIALGYEKSVAVKVVNKVSCEGDSAQDIIKKSLKAIIS
ncbi:MAG: Holliday junction branch migration protein RuvA [Lachnospirales bacterium]